ncbi:MAG TPA: hypothetical protein VNG71_02905 [Pyrinomonadaceae bacterium]|nr:hypothetical protein [Pyrinomonadaceae bacterium]
MSSPLQRACELWFQPIIFIAFVSFEQVRYIPAPVMLLLSIDVSRDFFDFLFA